jgi:uncharacterized protein DUF4386
VYAVHQIERQHVSSTKNNAILAGVFFIVAAAAAIAGLALYDPVLNDPGYITDASRTDTQVLVGAFCEVLVVISVIGTGVTLYPVVRRFGEATAIAYLVGRLLEAAVIAVGIISLLSIVALRQDGGGDVATGKALVALHDATFLFGPGLAIGINTVLLASLMYRSQLVPRAIARIGLVGGPLVFASSVAVLFGAYDQVSSASVVAALPVFVWEMSLAVWMIAKGFRNTSPAIERPTRDIRAGVAVVAS